MTTRPRLRAMISLISLLPPEPRWITDAADAASLKPAPNAHDLAKAGMKSVSDASFKLLLVGSMSPF